MVYTDKIHLVADTVNELHAFAKKIGLKRSYYEGVRKGHPHYDLVSWRHVQLFCSVRKKTFLDIAIEHGAVVVDKRKVWHISTNSLTDKNQTSIKFQ